MQKLLVALLAASPALLPLAAQAQAVAPLTLTVESAAPAPLTIFGNATPHTPVDSDTNSVTLGVQFNSTQAGTVKGVRFYRGAKTSGGYSAAIFDASSGARLALANVSSEPCSSVPCWEELDFSSPLSIVANKTYVAAYFAKTGHYAGDVQGLANKVMSGPLTAPASSAVVGGNGVYIYGSSLLRPNSTWQASNYYVDIAFTSTAPPPAPTLQMSFTPPNPSIPSNTQPGTAVATVNVTWSDDVNGSHPFGGTIGFAQPYSNDGGTFAITGNSIFIDPAGPGVSGDANTTQNITVTANQ